MKEPLVPCAIAIFLAVAFISGCTENKNVISDKIGTIKYIDLEGGFYGIIDNEGNRYDPVNLTDEFKEDGLKVKFSCKILKDTIGTHMWGTTIELTDIQRI